MKILKVDIEMLKIRVPRDATFASVDDKMWEEHVDYILGERVAGFHKVDTKGNVIKTPSWELVLHYNDTLFEKVAVLINEGSHGSNGKKLTLKEALEEARENVEHRLINFIEQYNVDDNRKRKNDSDDNSALKMARQSEKELKATINKLKNVAKRGVSDTTPPWKVDNAGKGKVKGGKAADGRRGRAKGAGKTKTIQGIAVPADTVLLKKIDGKPICYNFQKGTCVKAACNFVHACQICKAVHGWHNCPTIQ